LSSQADARQNESTAGELAYGLEEDAWQNVTEKHAFDPETFLERWLQQYLSKH
jgi:hypothetical protein